jgi:hypothetical protein
MKMPEIPESAAYLEDGLPVFSESQMVMFAKQYGRDLLEEAAKEAFDADHMGSVNLKLMKNRIGNAIRKLKETL